jgi:TonB family protein
MNGVAAILLELNIAAACAIAFVLLVRRPAARLFGPHAAYGLWAMVPVAMAATFLPERTVETFVGEFLIGGVPASHAMAETAGAGWIAPALFMLWLAGAVALTLMLVRRQRDFQKDADIGLAGPAIVGFRHPRIVTPDDFERRFSHDERKLILTHEQVHIDRNDARINAAVAVLRCLFWFNPLVHIGAKAMRIDQELSCDAEVIDRRPRVRRAYAETLLKTQLAARPLPVGCYWPAESQHPLAERIALIAARPVSGIRRIAAGAIVLALTTGAGLAAWAAQPERTIFRETADVLLPFQPIPRDGQMAATRPTLQPQSIAWPRSASLPHSQSKAEVGADLCISATGAVDTVTIAESSGSAQIDQLALGTMQNLRFDPARRDGMPVNMCGYRFTMAFGVGASPP